ncbi:MAG: NUDIX domain-containing protein [Clostridia bacterium]|nr:NUDIX domain-containing protein [Clostridia bacterium]
MDLTFKTDEGVFNYRVGAIILHDKKILALKNDLTPYYFLPGGRVKLHETAENAIRRELKEELGIDANVLRPLWLAETYFVEDVTKEKFHEICVYFLVDVSNTRLVDAQKFRGLETKHNEVFEWLNTATLKEEYFYPLFIKTSIDNLPDKLEIHTEYEY